MSTTLTQEQRRLIRTQLIPQATDADAELFCQQVERTGLDPFSRQIYGIVRNEKKPSGEWAKKLSIQVGIDGFRLIAERTGQYEGQEGPFWTDSDGQWRDVWLVGDRPPAAAKIGVWRKGFRNAIHGVATMASYAQVDSNGKLTKFWANMPDVMIAKVAEAIALRRAFPQELSGLYTADEMAQASNGHRHETQEEAPPPVKPPDLADRRKNGERLSEVFDRAVPMSKSKAKDDNDLLREGTLPHDPEEGAVPMRTPPPPESGDPGPAGAPWSASAADLKLLSTTMDRAGIGDGAENRTAARLAWVAGATGCKIASVRDLGKIDESQFEAAIGAARKMAQARFPEAQS